MKHLVIKYEYYGHRIEQTINIYEMIAQMPPALRLETIMELMELVPDEDLKEHQVVILRGHLKKILTRMQYVDN